MANERLRDVFEQNWHQARHAEQLRYSFINIYAVIVAGLLAIATGKNSSLQLFLASFLAMLSFVGIVINIKLGLEYYHRMEYIRALADKLDLGKAVGPPLGMYDGGPHTQLTVLRQVSRWPELLMNPQKAATSEVVSPGHWMTLLHIFGVGGSLGWLVGIFGYPLPGILIAVLLVLMLVKVSSRYVHGKYTLIEKSVNSRVESSPLGKDENMREEIQLDNYSKSS